MKKSQVPQNAVRSAKSFLIDKLPSDIKEFLSLLSKHGMDFPIVVKPCTSGGTEGVRLCHTFKAVKLCAKEFLHKENLEDNINDTLLIQEYLNGEEYVVNVVSYRSQHRY